MRKRRVLLWQKPDRTALKILHTVIRIRAAAAAGP